MGLGKTLTMLAAIIRTAGTAKEFSHGISNDFHLGVEQEFIPSRATLVVVPSPCKLSVETLVRQMISNPKQYC
jgi:hypothetical protein